MEKRALKLKRLTLKDYDASLLVELVKQGRVYVDYPQMDPNAYKREVVDYVRSIRDFVTMEWQDRVDDLWLQVVEASCFADCLAMKKGSQAGHMNRYSVTNIVSTMQSYGVYRSDVSMQALHLRLENTKVKNKYYRSYGNYALPDEPRKLLKQLLRRV